MNFRCSELKRVKNCPGSKAACEGITSKDSKQSLVGTQAHKALELYYKAIAAGELPDMEDFTMDLDSMTAYRVKKYAEVCDNLIKEHGGAIEIKPEESFSTRYGEHVLSGHPDLIVICADGTLILDDWKFNFLNVDEAADNVQLLGYVGLVSKCFASMPILALLAAGGNENPFTATLYQPQDIPAVDAEIESIMSGAAYHDRRNPSEESCRYCQAKCTTRCPETLGQIVTGAELLVLPDNLLPTSKLDAADLRAKAKELITLAKAYIDRIDEAVKADPDEWSEFFTLQGTGSTREITDVQTCYDIMVNSGIVTHAEFFDALTARITNLESAAKPRLKAQGIAVKDQKRHIAGLLESVIELKEKAATVKPVKG